MNEVLNTDSSLATVVRAIKLVEQLSSEGLPAARKVKPLSSFTASQRDFLQARLRYVADQHVEAVCSVQAVEVCSAEFCPPSLIRRRPLRVQSGRGSEARLPHFTDKQPFTRSCSSRLQSA